MAMTPEFQAFMEEHFSLDNYVGAADLDLSAWYNLFFLRHWLYTKHKGWDSFTPQPLLANPLQLDQTIQNWWCDNLQDFKSLSAIKSWREYDYFLSKKRIDLSESGQFAWMEVAYQPFVKIHAEAAPERSELESFGAISESFIRLCEEKKLCRHIDNKDVKESYISNIKIDMMNSDAILKDAFSEWLTSERQRLDTTYGWGRIKKPFNKSDIEGWVQYRTLPYLDILLASVAAGCPLNDDEVTYFLLPDLPTGKNGRDAMRPIKKRGAKMARFYTIQALGRSIASEEGLI